MGLFDFLKKKSNSIYNTPKGSNKYNTINNSGLYSTKTNFSSSNNRNYNTIKVPSSTTPVNNRDLVNRGYSTVTGSGGALVNPNPLAGKTSIVNSNLYADNTPKMNYSTKTDFIQSNSGSTNGSKNYNYDPSYNLKAAEAEKAANSVADAISSVISGGGGSSSISEPLKIDLSDILEAYTKSAEAQKKSISDAAASQKKLLEDTLAAKIKSLQTSESTQRENLLTSLKRYQEDTAKSRKQQQSSFNASRADLEAQAFMANRAAMQSAAARGLGGSGLQQLAQIQNMINQSGEVSDLALSNTDALDALAQAYARQEQDTNTNISNLARDTQSQIDTLTTEQKNNLSSLISEEANKLNEIETNTTSLKEQLKYQEAVRAENARIQAEQFAAQLQSQNAATASNYKLYAQQKQDSYNDLVNSTISSLAGAVTNAANQMKTASTSSTSKKPKTALAENNKAVQAAYDQAVSTLANLYAPTGLSRNYLDEYMKQLDSYYGQYYK